MSIHIYRYGESRNLPGLSIGVTRQAPRGIRKEERAERGYFDVWLPLLAPSRELLQSYLKRKVSFEQFAKRYRTEMKRPEPRQVISLLATLARNRRINLGCFCEDPATCHRSVLRDLVEAELEGESPSPPREQTIRCASPPCYAEDFAEDSG